MWMSKLCDRDFVSRVNELVVRQTLFRPDISGIGVSNKAISLVREWCQMYVKQAGVTVST
jgi:hypothetical protein